MTAITVAMKNKMDLSIGVAIGSSIQIALLVVRLSFVILLSSLDSSPRYFRLDNWTTSNVVFLAF